MDDGRQPSQKKSESVAAAAAAAAEAAAATAAAAAAAATQRFEKRSSDLNGKRKREKMMNGLCTKFHSVTQH